MMQNVLKLLFLLFVTQKTLAQIGIGTVNPHPSSILDVTSTEKGFLPPRVVNSSSITNPATGLMIYNRTEKCLQINIGTPETPIWTCLNSDEGSSSSSNLFSLVSQKWSTKLRFPKFGFTDIYDNQHEAYGITSEKNLYLWGRDYRKYIHKFNKTRESGDERCNSPYLIDSPDFNGKVEKFGSSNFTYAVLTDDNKIWIWGNQVYNIMGNNPTGSQSSSNGLTVPIEFPLPSGETGFVDMKFHQFRIFFLTESGNLYLRGWGVTQNFTTTLTQFAKPSGVSSDFKYVKILNNIGIHGLYLKGSNGKYYTIMFSSYNNFHFAGSSLAPSPSTTTYYNGSSSSSVFEIEFPNDHGEIIKIVHNSSCTLALSDNGKIYAWGHYEKTSGNQYKSFVTDATNTVSISGFKAFVTPVEVKLPVGETAFKDVSMGFAHLNFFVTESGKLYLIGNDSYNSSLNFGVTFGSHLTNYVEIVNTGGHVKNVNSIDKSILFSSEDNELFGLGESKYSNIGNPNNTEPTKLYFGSPTPLLNGNLDEKNDNPQNPN